MLRLYGHILNKKEYDNGKNEVQRTSISCSAYRMLFAEGFIAQRFFNGFWI